MALLQLDRVSKRFARGERGVRERVALREISLEIEPGELVAVWGRRRSGRTTLLQIAGGVEQPSEGVVRFDGVALAARSMLGAPGGIGYCNTDFARVLGDSVLEHVAAPLLGANVRVLRAQSEALDALRRVGAADCGELEPAELDHAETVQIAIARAIVTRPRLLLIDEPTDGIPPASHRDGMLALLRSIAHWDGIAVLATVDEATALAGADRALTIDAGELHGETAPVGADVVPLRRHRAEPRA
jgi:putative ABC transport system ATP-binding protein